MAQTNIRAVITAEDRASQVVQQFGKSVEKSSDKIVAENKKTSASFNQVLLATAGAGLAAKRLFGVMEDTLQAANKEQSALVGLSSITRAFKQDTQAATNAAQELAKDGLLTVGDAALGLKNLLAAGFELPQAIKLMERFKDSSAFGRQSALSFGQAVTSATEGIKNGNSILVDNAGVTKNLSVILEEAGFSAQDLMRATTDVNVRMALFNGIVKETNPQVGDAARLTELFAGKQAQLSAQTTILKSQIGEALQPAMLSILQTITPLVEKFAAFANEHPRIVAGVLLITTAGLGLISIFGALGLAIQGLAPIFAAFSAASVASINIVRGAVAGLQVLVATPMVMPAIAVAAALAAIASVAIAHRNLMNEIDRGVAAARSNYSSFQSSLDASLSSGRINQSEYDRRMKAYATSQLDTLRAISPRASGGPVNAGQAYIVGERQPEVFVPDRAGKIMPSVGGNLSINVNVGMYAGSEIEKRRVAQSLLQALRDAAATKNMTLNEMFGS